MKRVLENKVKVLTKEQLGSMVHSLCRLFGAIGTGKCSSGTLRIVDDHIEAEPHWSVLANEHDRLESLAAGMAHLNDLGPKLLEAYAKEVDKWPQQRILSLQDKVSRSVEKGWTNIQPSDLRHIGDALLKDGEVSVSMELTHG